jgi:hypothetical protein
MRNPSYFYKIILIACQEFFSRHKYLNIKMGVAGVQWAEKKGASKF